MSKQKDNSVVDIQTPPKKERDYGPPPSGVIPAVGAADIRADTNRSLADVFPPSGSFAPKKSPRRAAPNIQLLAKIDRLLQEADEKKSGTALSILGFLAEERGAILEAQE